MATATRTFGTRLLPAYVAGAIIEIAHFRAMTFDSDELAAFYLDSAIAIIDVGSFNIGKIAELDGDETDVEKSLAILKAESLSNKIGLKFLTRKNNTGTWDEIAEFIILNFGRKDYLDLRGRLGFPSRVMERNDAIAVQLVDYGDGLLWDTDFIKIDFGCTIEVEKKNNVDALMARISALELALEGRLVNLPPGTLLGRDATLGTVQQIPQSRFATPGQITTAINNLVNASPTTLDTLNELALALGNNANFATTITNALALKAPLTSPVFSGFTTLGDNVAIKCKVINFTSPTGTTNTIVAAGLLPAMDKIVSLTGFILSTSTDYFPPNHYGGGTYANTKLWSLYQWSNGAYISLHPDAVASMAARPGKLIVTYIP